MEEKDLVAKNLVAYRKKAGLSQLELAKKLNYSNKNISKWENGETTPNVFILKEIANVYGITVDDLLCENTEFKEEEVGRAAHVEKIKNKLFKLSMLALSNAIIFAVSTIIVYILGLANITSFNKWLIYLYASPLSVLSVVIFVRVLHKYVSLIGLSLFNWLVCLSFYLSLLYVKNIALIFIVGAATELLVLFIGVSVNLKISKRMFVRRK